MDKRGSPFRIAEFTGQQVAITQLVISNFLHYEGEHYYTSHY